MINVLQYSLARAADLAVTFEQCTKYSSLHKQHAPDLVPLDFCLEIASSAAGEERCDNEKILEDTHPTK
jgi:hypothetical protein